MDRRKLDLETLNRYAHNRNMGYIIGGIFDDFFNVPERIKFYLPPRLKAIKETKKLVKTDYCEVKLLNTTHTLHIKMYCYAGDDSSMVEIRDLHNNIVKIVKNDKVTKVQAGEAANTGSYYGVMTDRSCLNLGDIIDFAREVNLDDVGELIERQILSMIKYPVCTIRQ